MIEQHFVLINKSIVGSKIVGSCPFWSGDRKCKIDRRRPCSYGLTEIRVPKGCPLKKGEVIVSLSTIMKEDY